MEEGKGNTRIAQGRNKASIRFPEFSDEWEEKKLGKLAEFSKGKGISKADIIEQGSTECIRYGELYTFYDELIFEIKSRTNLDHKQLVFSQENDVIIPASGESQLDIATASCVMKSGVALGGDLNIIRTSMNGVFLSYYLNSQKKLEIASLAQGISVVHLYSSQLSLLNLKIPSFIEQTKIASFFTAIDQKIQALKKKKTLLEDYKKAVMQRIFSQEIRFKQEDGEDFPDWEEKLLENVGEIVGGGTPDTLDLSLWGEDIPWFTPTEIKSKYLYDSNRRISKLGLQKSSAKLLPINTLLFSSRATVGDVAICKVQCTTNQGFQSIITNENNYFEFIYYWINCNKAEFIRRASGSTFLEINKTEISKIPITLPIKEEQIKIANFLSAIDEKIEMTSSQITGMESWKKGLLQQMFC